MKKPVVQLRKLITTQGGDRLWLRTRDGLKAATVVAVSLRDKRVLIHHGHEFNIHAHKFWMPGWRMAYVKTGEKGPRDIRIIEDQDNLMMIMKEMGSSFGKISLTLEQWALLCEAVRLPNIRIHLGLE